MSQLQEFSAVITHKNLNNVKTLYDRLCIEPMPRKFWPPSIYIRFVLPLHTKSLWLITYCQSSLVHMVYKILPFFCT